MSISPLYQKLFFLKKNGSEYAFLRIEKGEKDC